MIDAARLSAHHDWLLHAQSIASATTGAPDDPAKGPLRVLVVEDTSSNQLLLSQSLERRGHRVQVVANGQQAIELLQKDDFDVVLMDAEMPVMDGFEATAAIRRLSRAEKAHVPIIAVTAHASPEDQDRCQTAGMDAYIHKPIDLGELIQLIESLLGKSDAPHGEPAASSGGVPEGAASAASPDSALFDLDEAVSRSLGRYELFRQMVGYFYAEADAIVARIREAIAGGNADDVAQLAHRLKGTILYLGSPPALKAAAQVERIGRSGQLATAGEALDRLEALIGLLKQVLVAHRDGAVPGPSDRPGL